MPEGTQINLRVSKGQKESWKEYIDESGRFGTLSDLIRASVESEIQADERDEDTISPALTNDIERLREELTEVRQDVAWLRKQHQSDVNISDLAQTVFDELEHLPAPTEPVDVPEKVEMDLDEYREYLGAQAIVEPDGSNGQSSPQTASAIADRIGAKSKQVHDAIDHLQDQFLPVVEVDYQGETHYFKEE